MNTYLNCNQFSLEVRDKRPNDTREKSDGLNSGAQRSLMTTISIIITISLILSWIRR